MTPPDLRVVKPADAPPARAQSATALDRLFALADAETRLLASATGDHTPVEVCLQVAALRAEHAGLLG